MPKVKATGDVPAKEMDGEAKGVSMRVLVGPEDGAPNFVMREFTLEPDGRTPYHSHTWEHEVFVLEGTGVVVGEAGETPVEPNRAVFVAPSEKHCFRNTGDGPRRLDGCDVEDAVGNVATLSGGDAVVEAGRHEELLKQGGYYAELERRQRLEEELEMED